MTESIQTNNEDYGRTVIANEVVAIIAGLAASEIPGVASMSSGLVDDITSSLGMKSSRKGVKVEVADDIATISLSIIVKYGVKIPEMAENIRSKVIEAVETMTGLSVSAVNILVQGIHLPKESKEELVEEIAGI